MRNARISMLKRAFLTLLALANIILVYHRAAHLNPSRLPVSAEEVGTSDFSFIQVPR